MSARAWPVRAPAAPGRADLALWGGFALLTVVERATQGGRGASWWLVLCGALLLAAAGSSARRRPLVSWLVVAVLAFGQLDGSTIGPSFLLTYPLALVAVSYRAGRSVEGVRRPVAVFAVVVALGLFAVVAVGFLDGSSLPAVGHRLVRGLYLVVALVLLAGLPWLVGRYRRLDAGLAAAGWERARQLAREQVMLAERERLRERARIAQDVHDSLGHALSLIGLRAGVLEVDRTADDRLRGFAAEMRTAVGAAAEELRTVIGVLREDAAPAPVAPVHEGVAELVDRTALSGVDVRLERVGEPVALRVLADRAVYRVVQESLTNATKHAPGAPVTVRLAHGADETVVEVVNARPPAGARPAAGQGGRGLIGIEERVRVAGGVLTAGPHDGGFRVTATLPHGAVDVVSGPVRPGAAPPVFEEERRRNQWRLVRGVAVPVGLSLVVVVLVLGLYATWVYNSVLGEGEYAALRVGADRAAIEPALPAFELTSPDIAAEPARPPGSTCSYHLTSAVVVPAPRSVYRLCFASGVLVEKTVIPVSR
ncbi:sensor histidine kinase [Saccharothrix australiensis]|uniref:histidine kinase n=1 Tax=Saccharothrix australiensis TaxID=2072 RepID=A0A495VYM8_9PSEU|nr:sensor histidine kinase [Saccharothrix australiensis]RKT54522.1 signal transduction histidine kinase [Saccharothrix australiensis]